VLGPPDVPHGFTNTGARELRLVAIHGAARFITERLAGDDSTWSGARQVRRPRFGRIAP
jgi:hypothetical protein